MLRQFLAYLLAYGVSFAAFRNLDGAWRYVIIALAFVMAFAVTINGPAPLFARSYARSIGIAAAGCLVVVALCYVLALFGIDLLEDLGPTA